MKNLSELDTTVSLLPVLRTDERNNAVSYLAPSMPRIIDVDAEVISTDIPRPSLPVTLSTDGNVLPPVANEPLITASLGQVAQQGEEVDETPGTSVQSALGTPISGLWQQFITVARTRFQHKSLADFSVNPVVGCFHACRFCYVPEVSTNKQQARLKPLGVDDPDADWGRYGFIRMFDEKAFRRSLATAEKTSPDQLPGDGHGAIMFSTTTDPFQVIRHPDPQKAKELTRENLENVRRSLEIIRDESTRRVRILTRGLIVREFFPLFKTFGKRLLFGMSVPTLNDKLARVYEPNAPSVTKRLETLKAAKSAGLNIYVAIAPTYPECDEEDLRATMKAVAELEPVTIFMEPINMRAENVARIQSQAETKGATLDTAVFATEETWQQYALNQLKTVERIARELGVLHKLHLWPDPDLKKAKFVKAQENPSEYTAWIDSWWNRISEWPGVNECKSGRRAPTPAPSTAEAQQTTIKKSRPHAQKSSSFTFRSPSEILATRFDPNDFYLANGMLVRGRTLTILGPGGLGKSRLLLLLAACTIVGRPFLGIEVRAKKLKWLILQAENGDLRLQSDLRALKAWVGDVDWELVEKNLVIHSIDASGSSDLSLGNEKTMQSMTTMVKEFQPDVIGIDPLASFAVGSLNNDEGMRSTCRALDTLTIAAGKRASMVVLHHTITGKAGVAKAIGLDRNSYGRGSKALHSWTRAQLNLAPGSAESDGTIVASCGKLSDFLEFQPFGIHLNPETMIYEVDPDFDLENWKIRLESGESDVKADKLEQIANLVRDTPRSRQELCTLVMEHFHRGQATAYGLIKKAEGRTIQQDLDKLYYPLQRTATTPGDTPLPQATV